MKSFNLSRLISLILTVALLITAMPLYAFAEGISAISETAPSENESSSQDVVESKPFEETVRMKEMKQDIAKLLNKYLGALVMSEENVKAAVSAMDEDTQFDAFFESEDIVMTLEDLTDAELYFFERYEGAQTFQYFYNALYEIISTYYGDVSLFAADGKHTPVTGVTVNVSGATDNSMSSGAVTVTAKGSGGIMGWGASAKTATITIYNESGATATISFDWTASSVNELKIDGTKYTGTSGNFTKVIDAGASFTITVTTAKNSTTNTLVMKNFSVVAVKEESNVTFDFDSALGSVTVDGNAVSDGGVVTISKGGASVVAAPASGATFLGWINADNHKIISKVASFTLVPSDDMTVIPVFAKTSAWFIVNGDCLYDGLNAALTAVANVSNKTVVLANNGTLPAGDYTIPAGITLLIPYNNANTLCTTAPTCVEKGDSEANYITPSAYRTLTMASGAKITVNGAISVSGSQYAGQGKGSGVVTGPVGFIKMESDSAITVNSGAKLYAWGFIMGSGSITVKNGGTVYEDFQVKDWRGGTAVSDMVDNSKKVFPMSQYYIQNIEVPMTLEAGAVENGYMSVTISLIGMQGSEVPFVGPNGMFNITSGSVIKDYDEATDRLVITVNGEIQMKSLSISMKLGLLGSKTINSSKYVLPINSNITVRICDGSKINITQNIALLPGTQLIVDNGAECVLGEGNSIYVYDADEWNGKAYVYPDKDLQEVPYAPGRVGHHNTANDATVHIGGKIDASKGYIYVTASGASITAEDGAEIKLNPGTATVTYQAKQSGSDITYDTVSIKNLALISNDTGLGGTYEYINGAWVKTACAHQYTKKITVEPTCNGEGEATFTCLCGDSYTEAIAAAGHKEEIIPAVAPTCTTDGLTEGKKCSACGEVLVEQTVVTATGHLEETVPAVEATCTETGLTKGKKCSTCGVILVAQEIVASKGHTLGEHANCTDAGVCIECGVVLEAAQGHNEVIDEAKAPTCTVAGVTEGKHCDRCGEVLVAQQTVPATGHTEAIDSAVPADCLNTGLTEGKHCSVCNEVLVAQQVVDALGHNEVVDSSTNPTCTVNGLTEGKHCDRCGEVIVAQQIIPATGHTAGAEATCTEAQTCTVCGTVLVEALGHEWIDFPEKPATRKENGHSAYQGCDECGYSTDKEIYPALGEAEIDNYDDFIFNLMLLEEIANIYVKQYPSKDPVALVIKYIRTGVERYNSGSWGIMAGYEDADFAKFVEDQENVANAQVTDGIYVAVTGLKNLKNFTLPNGDRADIGHVFGAMDITYHNKYGSNHADVSGWAGDLVDLLEVSAKEAGAGILTGGLDQLIETIGQNYFLHTVDKPNYPSFSKEDYDGDLDAYYIMNTLKSVEYGIERDDEGELNANDNVYCLTEIFMNYMNDGLTDEYRAAYFMTNRLGTNGTRAQVRNAVYTEYLSNKLLTTLEGTRDLSGAKDLITLRRAVCYAFADYVCKLAGDYVANHDNPYFNIFSSSTVQLAPGITQESHFATSADGKQMVYYIATADITREDVHVYANYNENDPTLGWKMSRVEDQANAAQANRGDPNSPNYIPNYNVIVSVNADGFNMQTGEPGGLLIMDGTEYHGINGSGFFGITKDGKAVIGTKDDYNNIYKNQLKEAVGGFGTLLIKNGEIAVNRTDSYYSSRAPRTAVGITKTGKVVFMVLDGRQDPYSCGGSMEEIAQIMFEAGCVEAINLDGGGSTTFVARQPGADKLSVFNSPSDGFARSVSTSLLMVSTAPSSTEFDHAVIESEYKYSTIGTPVQLKATGISPAGNEVELPEGYTWAVSDDKWATVTADGVFTGLRNGTVEVYMMHDGEIIGTTEMNVVVPENVYFTRTHMDAVYGANTVLPVAASYNNKPVAFRNEDVRFILEKDSHGTINGNVFVGNEAAGVKVVNIKVCLANDESIGGTITLNMFRQGENTFDFDMATGGDRQFAWLRDIENATTVDFITYTAVDLDKDMTTNYIFALDMTQIPIPSQLNDLIYMLPGADNVESATAWNFLLQLAERVSVLTEITAVVDFDDNFVVDYSELEIRNEYFSLTSKHFDEATNTLTLKLNWIDQTKAIDPATANPLCMLTGIKLTPKDGANWTSNSTLSVVNTGSISYKGYLRANALYAFAQKPENQEIFGLHPFVNPDPQYNGESGAWFGATYATFEDSYTLAYVEKDGWTVEDGGYAYYVDGEKLTGVQKVDGLYYDFGENGINAGQTTYTGLFFDTESGSYRYAEFGVLVGGWKQIGDDWHLFDSTTAEAVTGSYKYASNIIYQLDKTGKVIAGVWVKNNSGTRYYYGPSYYKSGSSWHPTWFVVDGIRCCFNSRGYLLTGVQSVSESNTENPLMYDFGVDGKNPKLYTGIYGDYFYRDGVKVKGNTIVEYEGNFYYVGSGHKIVKNTNLNFVDKYVSGHYFADGTPMHAGRYDIDADGKFIIKQGPVGDYFYKNNVVVKGNRIVEFDGNFYYIGTGNKLAKNTNLYFADNFVSGFYFADGTPMHVGRYDIDADGKFIIKQGPVGDYFYINDIVVKGNTIIEYEGDFYYIGSGNKIAKNTNLYFTANYVEGHYFADGTPMHVGRYDIDAEGRFIIKQGPVGDYFYINDIMVKGNTIIEYEGAFYYIGSGHKLAKNTNLYFTANYVEGHYFADGTPMHVGRYDIDAEGRFIIKQGPVGDYFYINDIMVKGNTIIEYEGDIYYVGSGNKLAKGTNLYFAENLVSGHYFADGTPMHVGRYNINVDGKFIIKQGPVGDYFYINDVIVKGNRIVEFEGNFYYVGSGNKLAKGTNLYFAENLVSGHYFADGSSMVAGRYDIDADGRFLFKNGPIGDYFYINNVQVKGNTIVEYDGNFYYVGSGNKIVKGTNLNFIIDYVEGHYLADGTPLKPGRYDIDDDGRLIIN